MVRLIDINRGAQRRYQTTKLFCYVGLEAAALSNGPISDLADA